MATMPAPVAALAQELVRLPGIGAKTAQRLAFHVIAMERPQATRLVKALLGVKRRIGWCEQCFNVAEGPRCTICQDPDRDAGQLCVVEEFNDLAAIEQSKKYRGLYHVLGGSYDPTKGAREGGLRLKELVTRLGTGHVQEVVLAMNPTIEGEQTAQVVLRVLLSYKGMLTPINHFRITRPSVGLPMGGDLEYADEITVSKAFGARQEAA